MKRMLWREGVKTAQDQNSWRFKFTVASGCSRLLGNRNRCSCSLAQIMAQIVLTHVTDKFFCTQGWTEWRLLQATPLLLNLALMHLAWVWLGMNWKKRRKWDTNPKQTYDSANSSFCSFLPSPSVLGWVCIIKGASPLAACWHQVVCQY